MKSSDIAAKPKPGLLIVFIFFLIAICNQVNAKNQVTEPIDQMILLEDSLHRLAMRIIEPPDDNERLNNNEVFMNVLRQALLADSTLQQGFAGVRTASFLKDPRGRFRIVTWYVPFVNGTFRYFGFVQIAARKAQAGKLFFLNDISAREEEFSDKALNYSNWYGAFYLELIHTRHRRKDQFILLGWKGNDRFTRKRVIEPFQISSDGPVFGAQVFDGGIGNPKRIIFEHSARVSMSLNFYDEFRVGRRKSPTIVFDRLVPMREGQKGNFRYYVPEVNIFDGYSYSKGRWVFTPDLDARVFIDPSLVPLNPPTR
ncbi:MAG TPA: hypothetical protein VLH61_04505 [Bacteroidales bacterium]|nr:hypothetical protein [Bacteroidales bacterium]